METYISSSDVDGLVVEHWEFCEGDGFLCCLPSIDEQNHDSVAKILISRIAVKSFSDCFPARWFSHLELHPTETNSCHILVQVAWHRSQPITVTNGHVLLYNQPTASTSLCEASGRRMEYGVPELV